MGVSMTQTNVTEIEATSKGTSKAVVIEAALRCFERYGSHKTSMSDIASEAGISRKTLYRMFEDRPALVKQVLFLLLGGMASKAALAIAQYSEVKDAIIEGSIDCIRIGRDASLYQSIVRNETNYQVEQFIVQGNAEIRKAMVDMWLPVFERGRAEGLLRADLSDERLAEIIQNVHSLAQMREDETVDAQRAFLQDLLWAAITNTSISN